MIGCWGKPYGLKDQIYQHRVARSLWLRGRSLEAYCEVSPRLMIEAFFKVQNPAYRELFCFFFDKNLNIFYSYSVIMIEWTWMK